MALRVETQFGAFALIEYTCSFLMLNF